MYRTQRRVVVKLRDKKNTVKDQMRHMREGGDVPENVYEGGEREAEELDNELHQTRSDYYKVNINVCVYADDYELMERRAQAVINYFDEYEIEMQRSVSDQGKFFLLSFFLVQRKSRRHSQKECCQGYCVLAYLMPLSSLEIHLDSTLPHLAVSKNQYFTTRQGQHSKTSHLPFLV